MEKKYFAVWQLVGSAYSGGFYGYFFNSSADHYQYALAGLEELGAAQAGALVRRAKQVLFGFKDVSEATAQRRALLLQNESKSRVERLEALDELFWKDPDGLQNRCATFASENGLV